MNKPRLAVAVFAAITFIGVVVAILALNPSGKAAQAGTDETFEPLDESARAQWEGTKLDFIAKTGRIVTHENGAKELIFDVPELPGVEESLRMIEEAKAAKDHDLLPLCSPEYREYARATREGSDNPPGKFWEAPGCAGIPGHIMIGPPSAPGPSGAPSSSAAEPSHD